MDAVAEIEPRTVPKTVKKEVRIPGAQYKGNNPTQREICPQKTPAYIFRFLSNYDLGDIIETGINGKYVSRFALWIERPGAFDECLVSEPGKIIDESTYEKIESSLRQGKLYKPVDLNPSSKRLSENAMEQNRTAEEQEPDNGGKVIRLDERRRRPKPESGGWFKQLFGT